MTFLSKNTYRLATVSILALTGLALANENFAIAQNTAAPLFSWGFDSNEAKTDQALADANVQIKYDGVDIEPQLNVTANDGEVIAEAGEAVTFQTYWNYGAFIEKSEIRIFESDKSVQSEPFMVLPVDETHTARLPDAASLPRNVIYVVRVYDAKGRFDETTPKPLSILKDTSVSRIPELRGSETSVYGAAYGIDRTATRNIQVKGGGITVYGTEVSDGARVQVLGQNVLIDSDGQFAVQTILPYGEHRVKIDIVDDEQHAVFERDVHLDDTEFFYVAIGDVTLGSSDAVGPANFFAESDRDFDDVTGIGRGAFYVKGRVKGDYTVTAALDTGEDRIGDVLNNLDDKDPRQLLRRLDSDRFYPVYGDDSTLREDAPTQGRFYVKVEKDDSHILWGNFATQIVGTEFAHLDRGLYGGILDYNSKNTTAYGERRTQVTGFAADPGTLPAREEFRGTGGSVYFLERQDLSIGSER
ncbi:MAG: OmpA family protein, partial [Litorimonas sp.]